MMLKNYLLKKSKNIQDKLKTIERLEKEISEVSTILMSIEEGNREIEIEIDEQLDSNSLTARILRLKTVLKENQIKEKNHNWAVEGLAEFSEILRKNVDLGELYNSIISSLVKFIHANQGGIFIVNDENSDNIFLELKASYAYERKKYLTKTIQIGEGLVGQCFLEKDIIYLKQIPKEYITIKSGLGDAKPNSLIIVPLLVEDKVIGVIELASFKEFKEHEQQFLKKLADAIAVALNTLKINDTTRKLLASSELQARELNEAQEELSQNMEEIKATQEEITRQYEEANVLKKELEVRQRVLDLTTILSESDLYGTILFVNDKLCEVSKFSREELLGQPHNIFRHPDMPRELFKAMWTKIKKGEIFRGIIKNKAKDGTHYWVDATISPVTDENNKTFKYIGVRYVITDDQLAEHLYKKQFESSILD